MINLDFVEPTNEAWIRWKGRCRIATQQLVAAFQAGCVPEFTDLYKEQKAVYVSSDGSFHGKCAYCESFIGADQPGDLDHFRPRGRVTDADGHEVRIRNRDGQQVPHPGYYWLAYDWENLLPACADCNRTSGQKANRQIGKWDKFPVRGLHAVNPGEETNEQPLLLNPVFQDPSQHLEIKDIGVFLSRTEEGGTCIDIFGLNDRVDLVASRKRMYTDTRYKVKGLVGALFHRDNQEAGMLVSELTKIKNGELPYSASGRLAIEDTQSLLEPFLELMGRH